MNRLFIPFPPQALHFNIRGYFLEFLYSQYPLLFCGQYGCYYLFSFKYILNTDSLFAEDFHDRYDHDKAVQRMMNKFEGVMRDKTDVGFVMDASKSAGAAAFSKQAQAAKVRSSFWSIVGPFSCRS